ncbi:hypothetical protein F4810DRAFT_710580 [Camillea tinctor]|nr:hypothetical protein F4810DRAFT_710580 [Camillea tinctor]
MEAWNCLQDVLRDRAESGFVLCYPLGDIIDPFPLSYRDLYTQAQHNSARIREIPGDATQPVGTNPTTNFGTTYLGFQTSNNSCSHRDLGFTGELAGQWYAVYGDTAWCAEGVTDPFKDLPGFHGMQQFVPFNASWGETNQYGFGGTSLVESSNGIGAVFYFVNTDKNVLKGAGVARVELQNGEPTVTERYDVGNTDYWWPADKYPYYGDVAAFKDPRSNYIYAWGWQPGDQEFVYLTRVQDINAFDLSKYEYWWGAGQGWKTNPLDIFTPDTARTVLWMSQEKLIEHAIN